MALTSAEQKRRVRVPQGVTGLAQIRYRNNATWSTRIDSDLEYVDNIGPKLDLTIILSTIARIATARGVRLDQKTEDVMDL